MEFIERNGIARLVEAIVTKIKDGAWLPVKAGRDADGSITKDKIATGAVTKDKLSPEILEGNMVEKITEEEITEIVGEKGDIQ